MVVPFNKETQACKTQLFGFGTFGWGQHEEKGSEKGNNYSFIGQVEFELSDIYSK